SKLLFISLLLLVACAHGLAQDTIRRQNSFIAFPVAFYTPETRAGIGAGASYNFRFHRADTVTPASQIQLGFAFTQNKQWSFSLPFQFFFKERKHTLNGQIEWHNFNYFFYGVGGGNRAGVRERFDVQYPLIRINYLRRLSNNWYAGARWWFDDYDIYKTTTDGWLAADSIAGSSGSRSSGPGVVVLMDSRNNVYSTQHGQYLELVYHNQSAVWGSTYNFNRYRIDYRCFFSLNEKQMLAAQFFADALSGTVPFNNMAGIGSSKRMRGFYEGRYRDKNLLLIQAEYRTVFYKKLGGVAFINYAMLSPRISNFNFGNDHCSLGLGARYMLDEDKRVNIRLDLAWPVGAGKYTDKTLAQQTVFYFTIGEAF
ncbi:MAG: BamA/TamA family outer membrane protein, partial [Flavobacteriales bacterium]